MQHALQSVKKGPNRQNAGKTVWVFLYQVTLVISLKSELLKDKKLALQGVLTSIANGRTTVPLYAYAFRLLGFGPSLTSGSLSKRSFLTD